MLPLRLVREGILLEVKDLILTVKLGELTISVILFILVDISKATPPILRSLLSTSFRINSIV